MSSNLLSPQVELKIQRGIRQAEDKVVVAIQAALDDKKTYGELEESQFRNLVRVAETTDSTEVIKNFFFAIKWDEIKNGAGVKLHWQVASSKILTIF